MFLTGVLEVCSVGFTSEGTIKFFVRQKPL